MTDARTANAGQSHSLPANRRAAKTSTAWSGWIVFAGMMLMVVGMFQAIEGLVALFNDSYYVVSKNGLVVHLDYSAWGWIMLALAVANLLAGFGVLTGKTWARVWAIAAAVVSIVANIGFTSAYPIWVVMLVSFDVIVIYALCVHWDEVANAD